MKKKMTLNIDEEYIELIKSSASARGITAGDWIKEKITEAIKGNSLRIINIWVLLIENYPVTCSEDFGLLNQKLKQLKLKAEANDIYETTVYDVKTEAGIRVGHIYQVSGA